MGDLRFVLAAAVALAGCIDPASQHCADGRLCPPGTLCDDEYDRCLTQEQIDACAGRQDADPCELAGIPQAFCADGACVPAGCGDGVLDPPEQCEPDLGVTATCGSLGFYVDNGPVGCLPDCTYDTSSCDQSCGDGIRNGPEECELADLGGKDCTDFAYYQEAGLGCTTFCRFDVSSCTQTCGDHLLNGPEICEDDPPAGESCLDYGFDTGLLGCTGVCTADFGGCGYLGWHARPTGVPALEDVWGATPDDVWAVGPAGAVAHFDGDQWDDLTVDVGETVDLHGVWGASAGDVWVVGDAGRILHWNGSAWSATTETTADLNAVWGAAADDVWAVGDGGTILRWNGSAWTDVASTTTVALRAVWGLAADDVWAAGADRAVHWDGDSWQVAVQGSSGLSDVWGTRPDDLYFTSTSGSSAYWDGFAYRILPGSSLTEAAGGVRATNAVVAGNAFISHHDGTELAAAELGVPRAVEAVWGFADGTMVAVGSQGSALHWDTHIGWTMQLWPAGSDQLRDVWMASPYLGYAIGSSGGIYELQQGGRWTRFFDLATTLLSVWGTAADDAWFTGTLGIYHYTGGVAVQFTPTSQSIWAAWGSSADDVFAVGLAGTILRWNGSSWSPMTSGTSAALLAVWGTGANDVFAAGTGGTILHFDGSTWSPMTSGTTEVLRGLGGTAADDVWAVSQSGTVLHWDGNAWSPAGPDSDESFYRVLAFAPDDVLIGGSGGRLYHWDGSLWTPMRSLTPFEIIGMSGHRQAIYLAGGGGGNRMMRLIRPQACTAGETACADGTDEDCDGAVDCDDSECAADPACQGAGACSPGTVVSCGASVNGTTSAAGNQLSDYGCAQYADTGPDTGYRFTSPVDRFVTVTVAPAAGRVLDLIVVGAAASGACAPANRCVAASQPVGLDAEVTFRAYANRTYYFMVDGYRGEAANFNLQVSCP